jgi:apolipoprotein N-acyltransferase
MVRSTNSGTSAFVDHLGRILNNKFSPQEQSDVSVAQIDIINSEPTFYLKHGDLLSWIYLILVSVVVFFKRRKFLTSDTTVHNLKFLSYLTGKNL